MKEVGLGLIGCGSITAFHLAGLPGSGLRLRAATDADRERGKAFAAKAGCDFVEDTETLLAHPGVEAVDIATPTHLHYELACRALEAGKHVFCEKPLAARARDSGDLVRRARKAGRVLQVGYMRRFNPAFLGLRETVKRMGTLYSVRVSLLTASGIYEAAAGESGGHWSQDTERAGGYFLPHSGSHLIDLVRFVFGEPWRVSARVVYLRPGLDVSTAAYLEIEGGAPVTLLLHILKAPELLARPVWEETIEVIGPEGRILLENPIWTGDQPVTMTTRLPGAEPVREKIPAMVQWSGQFKAFTEAVHGIPSGAATAYEGYRTDFIMEAIRRAADGGESVLLTGDTA